MASLYTFGLQIISSTYVMRSRGIIRKLHMWHFQFSIWLQSSLGEGEVHFAETPLELVQWFQGYEELKDFQNNRKQKKFISFSGYTSQSMLLTSDWSR